MELVQIAEVPPIFYKDSAKIPVMQANGEIKKGFGRIQILFCDSGGIQTHNLLIRSQMLYSVELRNQLLSFAFRKALALFLNCECKGKEFFCNLQTFSKLFSKNFQKSPRFS